MLSPLLRSLTRPRMLLMIWGGIGALFLVYVIIASAVQSGARPGAGVNGARAERPLTDPRLLVGEMADFAYAFSPRRAPLTVFNDDVDGAPMTLAEYRGKAILVNFWATWCAPCKKELPALDRLQAARGGDDFAVVAVAADPKGREAATRLFDDLGVRNLDVLMDQRMALTSAVGGQPVLPLTILYDADGNEVGRLVGDAEWDSEEALALIDRAIDG